jgi:sugar lactone lactonase YvrE
MTIRNAIAVSTTARNTRLLVLALLGLVVFALPFKSIAQTGDRKPIVFVREWGRRGSNPGEFDFPIGIAISAADEVFITDHINCRIQRFDGNGRLLGYFTVRPNPGGIALDACGNVYLTRFQASGRGKHDSGNCVTVYNSAGRFLRQWGQSGSGEGEFNCPGGIAVSQNNRVYVADQTNRRVQIFDGMGKFLFKWGEYGNTVGQFGGKASRNARTGGPQFVALDSAGNVWTTEGANCRIQEFTAEGKHLLAWGTAEDKAGGFGGYFAGFHDSKSGGLVGPIGLCFDKHGQLWVSAVSGRVQQFTQQGQYLRGLVNEQGNEPGHFYAPHGLAFDSAGCLYVVDSFNHRIQKFSVAPH